MAQPYVAGLLLLAIGYQQLVGRSYVRRVYYVEIEAEMNQKEAAVAQRYRSSTGIDAFVEADGQAALLLQTNQRSGYGAPVVFSKEIDGELYHFTVDQEAVRIACESGCQQAPLELPNSQTLLQKLFPDYYFDVTSLPGLASARPIESGVFEVAGDASDAERAIPYPPPRQV